jgi:hypothetical protein
VSDRSYQKTEPFICNRPFLYMILTEVKDVLFIGQYVQAIGEVLEVLHDAKGYFKLPAKQVW